MAEKFTLSLTAAEIDARLKKVPESGKGWDSIVDQTFNATSRFGQSGAAIAEYVEDYVTDYVTDSVDSTAATINGNIASLEQSLGNQVSTLSENLESLASNVNNLEFDAIQNKPFYSEINYKNAQTLIPLHEVSFEVSNSGVGIAHEFASSDLPVVAGGAIKFILDGTVIQDTIKYSVDQYEPIFSIGSTSLLEEDADPDAASQSYCVEYRPTENKVSFALSGLTAEEQKHTISLIYTTTELPVLNGDYETEEVELADGSLGCMMSIRVCGLKPTLDVFNLTFNNKTHEHISFLTPEDILSDPDLIKEFSGIYFMGNPSIIDPVLPATSDDFFIYLADDGLLFATTAPDALQSLSFTKLLQESEYVHKLDDKYLAYTESYVGNVTFDRDVLIDGGDTSIRELKKDVEALEAKPDLLVEGQFVSPDYYKGLSANREALPTNNKVWIEGSAGQPMSASGTGIAGYGYTMAKMQLVDNYLQIRLDFSNNGESSAKSVYAKLENYRHVKVADSVNSYLLSVISRECNGTTLLFNCTREGVLDFTEERDIKTLIFYPYLGSYSHSEGYYTYAFGYSAHSEGSNTTAGGDYSHAEGESTEATGAVAHAEGDDTIASGDYSHAEGYYTKATGARSHAEGSNTETSGAYAHAEGDSTIASGSRSHAEGYYTTAGGDYSHAEGYGTKTPSGAYAHAEGYYTEASGPSSHAEGNNAKATGSYSHAEGNNAKATGEASHAEGHLTEATGDRSHAEGYFSIASGEYSHTEGYSTDATAVGAHAEGFNTTASGDYSHAECYRNIASGDYSHAEGYDTEASGPSSHAEGNNAKAVGSQSHAEGNTTKAVGHRSHAEGYYTEAAGDNSHAEGSHTIATGDNSHVEGKYNIVDTEKQYAHILGNGTEEKLSNAHTVDWFGNAWFAGNISASNFINETSGEPLGTSTSNGVVLNDIETDLAYVLQIKNGQLSMSLLPEEITISKLPNKLTYIAGEYIDLSGIEFLAHYPDGSTKVIEPNSIICDPNPLMDEGDIDVQVKIRFYSTFEAFFSVTVEPFNPELVLIDFTYEVDTDGTYILTGWNETLNGVASTEIVIPDNAFIKL